MSGESMLENHGLLDALHAFQQAPEQASEQALIQALQAAQFLLVTKEFDAEDVQTGMRQLSMLSGAEGETFLFGFSDQDSLTRWSHGRMAGAETMLLPFSEVTALVLEQGFSGFVINPGTEQQYIFPDRILAAYSGRGLSVTLPEHAQVVLGTPRQFPEALGAAVRRAVQPIPEVQRLWLLLKMLRQSGEKSILIVVERRGGDYQQICQLIGHAASGHLPSSMSVELLEADSTLGQTALARKELRPFFDRTQQDASS